MRRLLLLAFVLMSPLCAQAKGPNIVLIMADDK